MTTIRTKKPKGNKRKNLTAIKSEKIKFDLTNKDHCKFLFGKHWRKAWNGAMKEKNEPSEPSTYFVTQKGTSKTSFILTRKK